MGVSSDAVVSASSQLSETAASQRRAAATTRRARTIALWRRALQCRAGMDQCTACTHPLARQDWQVLY